MNRGKCRRYRNRRIGEFLKELHLTEGRNTGFKKILDALRQNGSPLPEFETNEAHDYFIARLFVREGFYDYEGGTSHQMEDNPANDPVKNRNSLKNRSGDPVNDPVKAVFLAICENPGINAPSLAPLVGKSLPTVKRAISKLKALKKIEFRGTPKTGGYYSIEKA